MFFYYDSFKECKIHIVNSGLLCLFLATLQSLVYYGPEQPRIQTEVLGRSLVRSLIRLHCSFVYLLPPACFTCALHCARVLPNSWESG